MIFHYQKHTVLNYWKRQGSQELNTLEGGIISLQDDESKQQFVVDTGGASVLLHCSLSTPSGPSISGADGRDIPC
jgi:hypothetical protein